MSFPSHRDVLPFVDERRIKRLAAARFFIASTVRTPWTTELTGHLPCTEAPVFCLLLVSMGADLRVESGLAAAFS